MTKLSEHFTLEEMTYSSTAIKKKINNIPNEDHLRALKHTCEYLLEPLRKLLNEHYGKASIQVTSGYRCESLNRAVGGAANSNHVRGAAADIQVKVNGQRISYLETYKLIKQFVKAGKLSVDECICEKSGGSTWIHIAHDPAGKTKDRKKFLRYVNGRYLPDSL